MALADRGARPRRRAGARAPRVAAYYRSLFLNVALPGGVLGDVHRGLTQAAHEDVGHGLRAVAWERSAGQVVQAVLTVAVLLVAPSPVQRLVPCGRARALARGRRRRPRDPRRHRLRSDLRALLARRAWPAVACASALVVAGHATTFLVAARTAGATAPVGADAAAGAARAAAAALPNVGGWGPREGVTAWAFAAAGLGASRGVATAVVYGVLVFVASPAGRRASSRRAGSRRTGGAQCLSVRTRC